MELCKSKVIVVVLGKGDCPCAVKVKQICLVVKNSPVIGWQAHKIIHAWLALVALDIYL